MPHPPPPYSSKRNIAFSFSSVDGLGVNTVKYRKVCLIFWKPTQVRKFQWWIQKGLTKFVVTPPPFFSSVETFYHITRVIDKECFLSYQEFKVSAVVSASFAY